MARPDFLERVDFVEMIVFITITMCFHRLTLWVYHLDECVLSLTYRWLYGHI